MDNLPNDDIQTKQIEQKSPLEVFREEIGGKKILEESNANVLGKQTANFIGIDPKFLTEQDMDLYNRVKLKQLTIDELRAYERELNVKKNNPHSIQFIGYLANQIASEQYEEVLRIAAAEEQITADFQDAINEIKKTNTSPYLQECDPLALVYNDAVIFRNLQQASFVLTPELEAEFNKYMENMSYSKNSVALSEWIKELIANKQEIT